jgi:hypothetical protein
MRARTSGRMWAIAVAVLALAVLSGTAALVSTEAERRESVFHTLSVAGTPRECGLAVGKAFGPTIHRLLDAAERVSLTGRERLRERARTLAPRVSDDHRREMEGIAEGAGLAYEDVLVLNCWYELEMMRFACRQIVALAPKTESGHLIHGRNLDWPDYGGGLSREILVLDLAVEGKNRVRLVTWPGVIGALTGTSDAGLTIAMNQLGLRVGEGEPLFLLMRRVLEDCDTLEPAVEMLTSAPVTADGAIVVSDAEADDAACVEWYGWQARVRRPEEGILAADNAPHVGEGYEPQRESQLWRIARGAAPFTAESMCELLGERGVVLSINLYSCVFIPQERMLHLASGAMPAAVTCTYARIPRDHPPTPAARN